MTLEPDFRDYVELLNKYTVEYMIVGGYALAFHVLGAKKISMM